MVRGSSFGLPRHFSGLDSFIEWRACRCQVFPQEALRRGQRLTEEGRLEAIISPEEAGRVPDKGVTRVCVRKTDEITKF
jgi:hypothetical protein